MSGGIDITVVVEGAGGVDITDEYEEALAQTIADNKIVLKIIKSPDCCPICEANEDPVPILVSDGLHPNCRCVVVRVVDDDGEPMRRT